MEEILFKALTIFTGLYLIYKMITSLAKRQITDSFAMVWGLVAICLILAGFLLEPKLLAKYVSTRGLVIVVVAGFGVLFLLWNMSVEISRLVKKNLELAMQVSLLNQEHDRIAKELKNITGKSNEELWR